MTDDMPDPHKFAALLSTLHQKSVSPTGGSCRAAARERYGLAEALKTMSLERLKEIETIDPTPLPPWRTEAFTQIEI
ncbi:hypothetical protein N7465_008578 [Penicillium sp. CMV-2018d]|nr:hypothetical protein N7465_008578 [Penicillium sp. CMV-2018d]